MKPLITPDLLAKIKRQYRLNWHGIHGVIHWSRVYENGMKLSEQNGVNNKVLQFFSVFHDSGRWNENKDPEHGKRGAKLAIELRDDILLDDDEFSLLLIACRSHTAARTHEDITVQACFDSDRLDLGRIGKIPDPDFLCTPMAKKTDTINWGYERSLVQRLPKQVFGLSRILLL